MRSISSIAFAIPSATPTPNLKPLIQTGRDTSIRLPHPKAALGMLMVEAFAPNGLADLDRYRPMLEDVDPEAGEAADDAWWAEVCEPFRLRYEFW